MIRKELKVVTIMSKYLSIPGSFILLVLLISACTNGESENSSLDISFEEVEAVYHENTPPLSADDYADMTAYATVLFENRAHMIDQSDTEEVQKWFIRYYIQREEFQEEWDLEEIIQLAEDRYIYENAWRTYANEAYDVQVTDKMIDQQAHYNIQVYEQNTPALIEGMSQGLDKDLEEFLVEFDRDHAERTVIWQRLIPKLLEESEHETTQNMNGVHLREKFDQEVEEYLDEMGEISFMDGSDDQLP